MVQPVHFTRTNKNGIPNALKIDNRKMGYKQLKANEQKVRCRSVSWASLTLKNKFKFVNYPSSIDIGMSNFSSDG